MNVNINYVKIALDVNMFCIRCQHKKYKVVDNVNCVDKHKKNDTDIKIIKLKSYESVNESNLMTIPFVSFKKAKVFEIERTWVRSNGEEVGITIKGSTGGCPTMAEMDVLLALFRIMMKNKSNQYTYNENNNIVDFDRTINFTYKELADELGYADISGKIKKNLEKSIKILNETTIYSNFAFRDIEIGEYVADFKGEESCRIISKYKSYSMSKVKRQGKKYSNYKEIREQTSVEIDEFFFNNMCNNYFKIYNYKKYMSLTQSIAKKLFLILSQWSHGSSKYITYKVLYDYIGLDIKTDKDRNYYNRRIKDAIKELKEIKFIDDFEIKKLQGITFIFNKGKLDKEKYKHRYLTFNDIYIRLRDIGFDLDDINKYVRLDNESYIAGLLRYIDDKLDKGYKISNLKNYIEKGLKYENYDVREYEI